MIKLLAGKTIKTLLGELLSNGTLVALLIFMLLATVQTARLASTKSELTTCEAAQTTAAAASVSTVAEAAIDSLENYFERANEDRGPVALVGDRTRAVCVRPENRVPVPAPTAVVRSTGSEAQNGGSDAQWLALLADDIEVCQAELNRLDAIISFHNATVNP